MKFSVTIRESESYDASEVSRALFEERGIARGRVVDADAEPHLNPHVLVEFDSRDELDAWLKEHGAEAEIREA